MNTPLRFGLPYLLETKTIEEAVRYAAQYGLDYVELNTNFPQCLIDRMDAEALKRLAEKYGVFYTLHLDDHLNFLDFNPLLREASFRTIKDSIEFARSAGIEVLNLHFPRGNVVTLPSGVHSIFEQFGEEFRGYLREFAERCTELIDDRRVTLCIENTAGWLPYEQEAIEFLLDYPVFALTLDTGHDHLTGNKDLAFIRKHADRLKHMHLHDSQEGADHRALGTGEIPIHDRLDLALQAEATVTVEVKTLDSLIDSIDWLREAHY